MRRIIALACFLDAHIVDHVDDGDADAAGTPNPNRRRLVDALGEKLDHPSMPGRKVQAFQLLRAPDVVDAAFDEAHLKDRDGGWALPSAAWLAAREGNIATYNANTEAYRDVQRNVVANGIAEGIKEMAREAVAGVGSTSSKKVK